MSSILFLTHVAATWWMAGVIWLVQLGVYPLFASVDSASFPDFYAKYNAAISFVVIGPMFLELLTGALLVKNSWGSEKFFLLGCGFFLMILIWLSTFFIQVPLHAILARGFEAEAQQKLVTTNWIRTVLWTVRGALVFLVGMKGMFKA